MFYPGDRVVLCVPENQRLHGGRGVVERVEEWGAHVAVPNAATGRFRALWSEMTREGEPHRKEILGEIEIPKDEDREAVLHDNASPVDAVVGGKVTPNVGEGNEGRPSKPSGTIRKAGANGFGYEGAGAHLEAGVNGITVNAKGKEGVKSARERGCTGNFCPECGNGNMVRNGTCEKCMDCGATSGCS